jgi:hypothetical protein
MTQRLEGAVKRRPIFNESFWDKDRFAAVAALSDFHISGIWTGVSF